MGLFGRRKKTRDSAASVAPDTTKETPEIIEPPKELEDPGYPEEHPRQMLHQNLCTQSAMVWYSSEHDGHDILKYVLDLIDLAPGDLSVTTAGFGITPDKEGAVTVTKNRKGYAVFLFPNHMAERAHRREFDIFSEGMSRGEYDPMGRRSAISRGEVLGRGEVSPFTQGDEVLEYVNGAELVPISQTRQS